MDDEVIALIDDMVAAGAEPWEIAVALVGLLGVDETHRLSAAVLEQIEC